jgi:hypothetical protein
MRALGDDVAALRLAIGGNALHKLLSHKAGGLSDADKEVQESFCVGFKLSCSRNDDPMAAGKLHRACPANQTPHVTKLGTAGAARALGPKRSGRWMATALAA